MRRLRPALPAAGLAVVLAVASHGLLELLFAALPEPRVPTGVYSGWLNTALAGERSPARASAGASTSTGAGGAGGESFGNADEGGRFQVPGSACVDAGTQTDQLVVATLGNRTASVTLSPPAVRATSEEFSFGAAVPVYTFQPGALADLVQDSTTAGPDAAEVALTVPVTTLVLRCRDHSETDARLGAAALRVLADRDDHTLTITPRRAPPASGVLGVYVISNDGDTPITLDELHYAPVGAATGTVRAAAGDRAHLPSWLGTAYGNPTIPLVAPTATTTNATPTGGHDLAPTTRPLAGTVDPGTLTPWDVAYVERLTDDAGLLSDRRADQLDLLLLPGEVAIVVVDERSLTRTLLPRPVLLYPVLTYRQGSTTRLVGLRTAVFGTTPSRR